MQKVGQKMCVTAGRDRGFGGGRRWQAERGGVNFLAQLFSACIGFYIAPAGRRLVAAGGAMPLFGVVEPVEGGFSYSFAPAGQRRFDRFIHCRDGRDSSAPSGAGLSCDRFHGLRFAGFAGCAPPVATILRPIRGEKHRANNNGNKVLHSAMNFNHTHGGLDCGANRLLPVLLIFLRPQAARFADSPQEHFLARHVALNGMAGELHQISADKKCQCQIRKA
jgi:hypothetical protein